jgi:hypothetical protein
MTTGSHAYNQQATVDAITSLAEEIARVSPDCADKALRIIRLLGELDVKPDGASIADAIDAQAAGDMSDTTVRNATSAVVRTLRDTM